MKNTKTIFAIIFALIWTSVWADISGINGNDIVISNQSDTARTTIDDSPVPFYPLATHMPADSPVQISRGTAAEPVAIANTQGIQNIFSEMIVDATGESSNPLTHPMGIRSWLWQYAGTSSYALQGAFWGKTGSISGGTGGGAIHGTATSTADDVCVWGAWLQAFDQGHSSNICGLEINTTPTDTTRSAAQVRGQNICNYPGVTDASDNDWGLFISGYGKQLVLDPGAVTASTTASDQIYIRSSGTAAENAYTTILNFESGMAGPFLAGFDFRNATFTNGPILLGNNSFIKQTNSTGTIKPLIGRDSSNNIIVGDSADTTFPTTAFYTKINARNQSETKTYYAVAGGSGATNVISTYSSTSNLLSNLSLIRSHHDTNSTNGTTLDADYLGGITFSGVNYAGTPAVAGAARILVTQSGSQTSGDTTVPGKIAIQTSPGGSTGVITRQTINPDGTIAFNSYGAGVAHLDASGNLTSSSVVPADISDMYEYTLIRIEDCVDGTAAPAALDSTTRKPYKYRSFDGSSAEDVNFIWRIPEDCTVASGINYRLYYLISSSTAPSSEGVTWGIKGVSIGNSDATNASKGSVAYCYDTLTSGWSQWDLVKSGWSNDALVITGAAAGEIAEINLSRYPADANDTYEQDVSPFAVEIRWVKNPAR